jgi:thioredoxin reductase (NADPH)
VSRVVVLGSGPAGLTAALYLSRANLAPTVFEGMEPGGQLTTTTDVDNFPGFPEGVMGPELMERMKAQCARFGTTFEMDEVVEADLSERPFKLKTSMGKELEADALVVATGASARYLGLPNELRLRGYGVSACATCDGFFFQEQEIAVVGGGDSAMEEATFLTKFAKKVYLIHRRDTLRASKIMQKRAFDNDKVEFLWNTTVTDVHGDDSVTGLTLQDTAAAARHRPVPRDRPHPEHQAVRGSARDRRGRLPHRQAGQHAHVHSRRLRGRGRPGPRVPAGHHRGR